MCGGKANVDTSVQDQMLADSRKARAEEEARQARIKAGGQKIDQAFSGFDNGFYDGYRDKQVALYQPELNDKFNRANSDLTFALARAGTLNSTIAGDKQADLLTAYDTNRAGILSRAQGAANTMRGNVANEKSNLVSMLTSTADADRASNEALARSATLLQDSPGYSPLGDIFAGIASGIGNYYAGQQNQQAYNTYFGAPAAGTNGRIVA